MQFFSKKTKNWACFTLVELPFKNDSDHEDFTEANNNSYSELNNDFLMKSVCQKVHN